MELSKDVEKAFLKQINKEYFSEYLYLSMKAYFLYKNLNGFANWMDVQVQEERAHAEGMFNYVIERGGKIELDNIDKPAGDWESPIEVFEQVLSHEQFVTSSINELYDVAEKEKDRAAMIFLNWYVKEQVEEEASASNILEQLKLIGNDSHALLALDKELMTRTFNPPVIG